MEKLLILAVDDEQPSLNAIFRSLRRDYNVVLSPNGQSALEVLKSQKVAVIIADQRMPEMTGIELFRKALDVQPDSIRILITGYTDIKATIESINQAQIFYYINKPWEPDDLQLIVKRAAERHLLILENRRLIEELQQANQRLQEEKIILQREAGQTCEFKNIIGQSPAIQQIFKLMRKIIPAETTVLLTGETGTGKELIAKAIHYNGPRREKLFVAQNCAALPDTLLESELFGHVRGAFTGASSDKKGLFELADNGTIFLDEIGDTSPALQLRLLRVIQEGEIRPVGAEHSIKVNVRIISATNRDLQQALENGKFREDLYYRLNVFPIRIPPLRERREDIPLLALHFLDKWNRKTGKNISGITPGALKILTAASFPGNVRQLENEIERAVALADTGEQITEELISPALNNASTFLASFLQQEGPLKEITESLEKHIIRSKLEEFGGNVSRTARNLGLSRVGLQKKIDRYGINFRR